MPTHGTRCQSHLQPLPLITHRRFFKSPHFDGWYRQRRKEMARKLEALHLETICEAVRRAAAEGDWGWGGLCNGRPYLFMAERRDLDAGQV